MTIIIAKKENDKITMGADHCVTTYTNYNSLISYNPSKILQGPDYLIGAAGDGATSNKICRQILNKPLPKFVGADLNDTLLWRDYLSDLHHKHCNEGKFPISFTSYLIAHAGRIFQATWNGELFLAMVKQDHFYIGAILSCSNVLKQHYPNGFTANDIKDIIDKTSNDADAGVKCWGHPQIISI